MDKMQLKTKEELEIMLEGGRKLGRVKHALARMVKVGVSAWEIEEAANKLIEAEGAEVSFKKVPRYHWATCINVNDGIVHGIPKKETIFKKGDIVSVDVGLFYKRKLANSVYNGFHTDTSLTVGLDLDPKGKHFLEVGQRALNNAIKQVKKGNRIYDISEAIDKTLKSEGLHAANGLVGHGIGRELHEGPSIPGYLDKPRELTPEIEIGAALAVEVMYTTGNGEIALDDDGWTIVTRDGTISALFEETILVTEKGPIVATK
jgi:methionyl aminopeptidase